MALKSVGDITLTVICEVPDCVNAGNIINTVTFGPADEIDAFLESYGHGSECASDLRESQNARQIFPTVKSSLEKIGGVDSS